MAAAGAWPAPIPKPNRRADDRCRRPSANCRSARSGWRSPRALIPLPQRNAGGMPARSTFWKRRVAPMGFDCTPAAVRGGRNRSGGQPVGPAGRGRTACSSSPAIPTWCRPATPPPGATTRFAGRRSRTACFYGRGACDMKGAIAAFAAGIGRFLDPARARIWRLDRPPDHRRRGRPGDQRHPKGARLAGRPGRPPRRLRGGRTDLPAGGRRDDQDRPARTARFGRLTVTGVQGHTAYPHQADKPGQPAGRHAGGDHGGAAGPRDGAFRPDQPGDHPRSTSATPATNVIPARAAATFNIRFNDRTPGQSLHRFS